MTLTSATRRTAARRAATGFTLLELIIVLAILAMGSMLVIPNVTGMNSRTFSAQVREASTLLNYARRTAIVTGQPAVASFQAGQAGDLQEDAASSPQSGRPEPDKRWIARGMQLAYRDSTNQLNEIEEFVDITFFPEGGSTGGELVLTQGAREAVIHVDPFSGRVSTEFPDE